MVVPGTFKMMGDPPGGKLSTAVQMLDGATGKIDEIFSLHLLHIPPQAIVVFSCCRLWKSSSLKNGDRRYKQVIKNKSAVIYYIYSISLGNATMRIIHSKNYFSCCRLYQLSSFKNGN